MSMVTGDDFMQRLVNYLRAELKPTKHPKAVEVRLNQQCLSYLAEKLADLEQQRAAGLDPSLGARVFRALFPQHSQLSELEELLPLVQVLHLQPAPESMDTGESIRLGLLPSLQGLELHGLLRLPQIDDYQRVRKYLKMLTLFQCGYDVFDRLMSGLEDQNDELPEQQSCTSTDSHIQFGPTGHHCVCWEGLMVLHVNRCGLTGLGATALTRLPNVEVVNLSSNSITEIEDFGQCYSLRMLDLSKNRIKSCVGVHSSLGNVESLALAANLLLSIGDLHRLKSLRCLNLSSNLLPKLDEVAQLQQLPVLQQLVLRGNPLDQLPRYRASVAQCFTGRDPQIELDGQQFSFREMQHAEKNHTAMFPHACQRQRATSSGALSGQARPRSLSKAREGLIMQEGAEAEAPPVDLTAKRWTQDLKTLREEHGDDYLVYASKMMTANNFFQTDAPREDGPVDPQASIAQLKDQFRETHVDLPSPDQSNQSRLGVNRSLRRDSDISL